MIVLNDRKANFKNSLMILKVDAESLKRRKLQMWSQRSRVLMEERGQILGGAM